MGFRNFLESGTTASGVAPVDNATGGTSTQGIAAHKKRWGLEDHMKQYLGKRKKKKRLMYKDPNMGRQDS